MEEKATPLGCTVQPLGLCLMNFSLINNEPFGEMDWKKSGLLYIVLLVF